MGGGKVKGQKCSNNRLSATEGKKAGPDSFILETQSSLQGVEGQPQVDHGAGRNGPHDLFSPCTSRSIHKVSEGKGVEMELTIPRPKRLT